MKDIIEFLTSEEIIIVYIIAGLSCLVCFIVYLVEKNNDNLRKKHNTKELNKLVEQIQEQIPTKEEIMYEEPILEPIIIEKEATPLEELLPTIDVASIEQKQEENNQNIEETGLSYTSIEPDQETAKIELEKLKEELERQEQVEQTGVIPMTSYEEEQEKTAIISLDELLQKSREMYAANEMTQYKDEGNEPISIQDLERQIKKTAATYDEPFIISNVVGDEDIAIEEEQETIHMDDFNTIKEPVVNITSKVEEVKKFKSSPIISPIFGIEKSVSKDTELALENTANYDKLDEQLRKSNDFTLSLNELQQKLD